MFKLKALICAPIFFLLIPSFGQTQGKFAVPGDVNQNGVIDNADLTEVTNIINNSTYNPPGKFAADVNQDGVVNLLDYTVVSQNKLANDNINILVNQIAKNDMQNLVAGKFPVPSCLSNCGPNQNPTVSIRGDCNGDGVVNIADKDAIRNHLLQVQLCQNALSADINGDGLINNNDYILASRIIPASDGNKNLPIHIQSAVFGQPSGKFSFACMENCF